VNIQHNRNNMIIGEISFCDQIAFNIKSDETKQYILNKLSSQYNLKIITKHFEKYQDSMLSYISQKPHMLCVRSNGNPYFLYLTRLNFVNYCIFIDKKIQQGYSFPRMIMSHFKFDDTLFDDTVIDGEMTKTTSGKWTFLIHDMVVHRHEHLNNMNFVKRINLLYQMLQHAYTPDFNDICLFKVKKFFQYTEAISILESHIHDVDYSCRGIYFKPLFLKFKDILMNFDDNLIKKVERQKFKHVKCFMLREDEQLLKNNGNEDASSVSSNDSAMHQDASCSSSATRDARDARNVVIYNTKKTNMPDVYEILDDNHKIFAVACVPSLAISKFMREIFINKNIVDTVPITYEFSKNFNKWMPVPSL
jgi:hypothetical protein